LFSYKISSAWFLGSSDDEKYMKGLEEELTLQKFKLMIDGLEHQYWEMEEAEVVYSIGL
jgi:hypothetical protein